MSTKDKTVIKLTLPNAPYGIINDPPKKYKWASLCDDCDLRKCEEPCSAIVYGDEPK